MKIILLLLLFLPQKDLKQELKHCKVMYFTTVYKNRQYTTYKDSVGCFILLKDSSNNYYRKYHKK